MNNRADEPASREEEIAFLVIEAVLGVQIELADAGAGNGVPDGRWSQAGLVHVVEVTSPPAAEVMRERARAERAGQQYVETGCRDPHLGNLHRFLSHLVRDTMAADVAKLARAVADVRHLFLHDRTATTSTSRA